MKGPPCDWGRAPGVLSSPGPQNPALTSPTPTLSQPSETSAHSRPHGAQRTIFGMPLHEAAFAALSTAFCVVLVLTNIIGTKLFEVFPEGRPGWLPGEGPLVLTSGILTYPLTFLLTDLVSELWGVRRASFMVVLGFVMSLMMLAILQLAIPLPPGGFWTNEALGFGPAEMQSAFEATFAYPGTLLFASMSAYLVAQLFDVRLYHFWWRVTGGKHMWIRNNGSTSISQLVDTIIVNSIFLRLAFGMDWLPILEVIVAVYLCKLLLAMLDTPLIYLGRAVLYRLLNVPPDWERARAPFADPGA
jgi:uncharacterized integral membrane protein (TIGR00697 family)